MKSFTRYINSATGDTPQSTCNDCSADCATTVLCTSERLKMIKNETKKFNLDIIQSETDTTFDVTLSEQNVADLIVLSVLGRLIGKKHNEKQTLSYVFNEYNDTLVPEFDTCKFEKILYVTLLCTTIAILILLLVLQMEKHESTQAKKDHEKHSAHSKEQSIITPTDRVMAFGNQLKYRV
tara:strand:- start:28213 stop:28752 length:540 start_codon:yes stop_codon:yes gene_type:complete